MRTLLTVRTLDVDGGFVASYPGLGRNVDRQLYGVSSPPIICRDVVLDKSPTLLSRWEKSGRGGTEDETVKLLVGIQRV
jgi:hypothetical protein